MRAVDRTKDHSIDLSPLLLFLEAHGEPVGSREKERFREEKRLETVDSAFESCFLTSSLA